MPNYSQSINNLANFNNFDVCSNNFIRIYNLIHNKYIWHINYSFDFIFRNIYKIFHVLYFKFSYRIEKID